MGYELVQCTFAGLVKKSGIVVQIVPHKTGGPDIHPRQGNDEKYCLLSGGIKTTVI